MMYYVQNCGSIIRIMVVLNILFEIFKISLSLYSHVYINLLYLMFRLLIIGLLQNKVWILKTVILKTIYKRM